MDAKAEDARKSKEINYMNNRHAINNKNISYREAVTTAKTAATANMTVATARAPAIELTASY
jgi:hypothetical protein